MSKIYAYKLRSALWALGMPTSHEEADRFADVYRAARKAGLNDDQAFALTKDAYYAARGYDFELAGEGEGVYKDKCRLRLATIKRNAKEHPNGKCAEDLRAAHEGRASRWGTPEFHSGAAS